MLGKRWTLVNLFGVPIRVDASWLLIAGLIVWSLNHYFAGTAPGLPAVAYWLMALVAGAAFFGCLVLHELGHAVTARALGVPIRGITLFLFGGVAEMEGEPRSAAAEFLIAVAGPAVSAVLGVSFLLLSAGNWAEPVAVVLSYLGFINLAVLAFNLIPAFPLDGGRVFRSALWALTGNVRGATWVASLVGQCFAWLLIGLGLLNFVSGHLFQGLWLILIGTFVNGAARASYQDVLVRQALRGEPLSRFVHADPVVVPPELPLRRFVEDYAYRFRHRAFPVCEGGRLVGVLWTDALARYPQPDWDRHTVGEAMERDLSALCVSPDADTLDALKKMNETGSGRLFVVDSGRLVGLLGIEDLSRFLELKSELEGEPDGPAEAEAPGRTDRPRPLRGEPDGKRAPMEDVAEKR